jgi:alpha-1,6-mannosyltransferase
LTRPVVLLAGLGGLLLALTLAGLALDVPESVGALRTNLLVGLMMAQAAAYFLAVAIVLRHCLPPRALWLVLGVGLLLRAILLPTTPFLSSDIYRYVWDGRVQAAGINPYRYVPVDPALAPLRDADVYPLINRPDYARTIYPPMAQLVFAAVGRVWDSVTGVKLVMVGFEALGVLCLLPVLGLAGLPRERILIYAWNPLTLWSFASDGHVDAIAVGLVGAALLLRARHRDGWAGAVLGCATLVKFFPIVIAPALLRGGRLWRPALAGTVAIVGLYAVYSGAGSDVLGFLPSYRTEEGLADGSGFWLLAGLGRLVALPPGASGLYLACVALGLVGLALLVIWRRVPGHDAVVLCGDASVLMAATMVAVSPHYPWYFAWLALPCVVAPSRTVLWLSAAPMLLYLDPWPHDRFLWPSLLYGPAIALLCADLWPRRLFAGPKGAPPCPLPQA